MVFVKKFSEFTSAGNAEEGSTPVGLNAGLNARFTLTRQFGVNHTTATRPLTPPDAYIAFNTDFDAYEYYLAVSNSWVQLQTSGDVTALIARLAAHTAGDGASMIGLENQAPPTGKTVQDLANSPILAQTDDGTLANGVFLSNLNTGFMSVQTGTGVITSRTLTQTANQINISNATGLGGNPIFTLSNTLDFPGTFTVQASTSIDEIINDPTLGSATATNLATAAAIKTYIDNSIINFNFEIPVVCMATSALTVTYNNGASGVGATLTNAGVQAVLTLDGVSPSAGQRVLIAFQASSLQNGIYTVTNVGSGATNWVLTRATDYDAASEIKPGDFIIVTGGTLYGQTSWIQTATVTTVGTDPITFTQFGVPFTDVVTISGTQTITGIKTFANNIEFPDGFGISDDLGNPLLTFESNLFTFTFPTGDIGFLISQASGGSPTSYIAVQSAVSNTPAISAQSSSSDANIRLVSKGLGYIAIGGSSSNSEGARLRLFELQANGTKYVDFKVADALTTQYTITLPSLPPSVSGQVPTTSTAGVQTWSGSAIVATNGVTFGSGNGTLNYYDAKTNWTPTITFVTPGDLSVSYATQTGISIRIGDLCWAFGLVTFTPTYTTASGAFSINGFTYASSQTVYGSGGFETANFTYNASRTWLAPRIASGTTSAIVGMLGSAVSVQSAATTNIPSGSSQTLRITMVYPI